MGLKKISQLTWRKSSHSGSEASACVEVAALGEGLVARDSKDPQGPLLHLTAAAWTGLLGQVKSGGLDL
jgi:hypothetical protein